MNANLTDSDDGVWSQFCLLFWTLPIVSGFFSLRQWTVSKIVVTTNEYEALHYVITILCLRLNLVLSNIGVHHVCPGTP
jgi:hypothetical protein